MPCLYEFIDLLGKPSLCSSIFNFLAPCTPVLCVPVFTAVCVMLQAAKIDVLKRNEVQKISKFYGQRVLWWWQKTGFPGITYGHSHMDTYGQPVELQMPGCHHHHQITYTLSKVAHEKLIHWPQNSHHLHDNHEQRKHNTSMQWSRCTMASLC